MLSSRGSVPEQAIAGDDFEARQAATRFFVILDKLGGSTRAAFVLRHLEGLSLEDAAEVLGVSLATMKRHLQRGSETIHRLVRDDPALRGYLRLDGLERGTDADP